VRKLFEVLARERPLVICVDDVQWAEPTLLDLLEHVAYLSQAAPIVLLCLARLEFLESRPGWPGTRVQLGPLSATESHELLTSLEKESACDEALQARIAAAAEGNPFFLEQMFAVEREGTAAAVPATIQALLGARLDRLRPEERGAVECAAVVGQVFWSGAVHHLSGVDAGRALLGLVRQELIRPRESVFAGEDAFEFVHLLVRDAAYASIPKEARADLHERVAGWLERNDVERGAGHGEIVGYHLEQAYRYRIELGPANDETLALAGRAGARLATAGRRAYLGGDTPAASGLLARAAALLPPNSAARDELLVSLAAALVETGDLESAGEAIEEMRVSSLPTIAALASIEGWLLQFHHEDFDPDRTLKDAEAAIRVFQAHGDDRGLARAWLLIGETGNLFGRRGEMAEGTRKSAEHARRAGDFRAEAEALRLFGGALVYGPTPVPEALGQLEPILGRNDLNLMVEAAVVAPLATLKAMAGEIDEARRLLERAREIYGELGLRFQLGRLGFMSSRVERRAGDLEAAQRELRESLEILTSIGETGRATTLAVELANIVCELGDQDEAMRLIDEVPMGHEHEPLLLATRGRILARVGETGTAERLVERAVELAAGTDDHDHHAEAMLALGEVRAAIGKTAEAASALEGAIELFRHKGDVVFERKTLCLLAQLQGEPLAQRD
jgi:tetratricopeptide (TPR) repeat protein